MPKRVFGPLKEKEKKSQHPGRVWRLVKCLNTTPEDLRNRYDNVHEDGRAYRFVEITEVGDGYTTAKFYYIATGAWPADLPGNIDDAWDRINLCSHVTTTANCDLSEQEKKEIKAAYAKTLEATLGSFYGR